MKEILTKPILIFLYGALTMALFDVFFQTNPRQRVINRQYELIELADKTLSKCNDECDKYFNDALHWRWRYTVDSLRHAAAAR